MKTALITGANRGIGLEFVRQLKNKGYFVIGSCRNPEAAKELKQLADEVVQLDVTSDADIISLKKTSRIGLLICSLIMLELAVNAASPLAMLKEKTSLTC